LSAQRPGHDEKLLGVFARSSYDLRMEIEQSTLPVVALVRDLMFSGKISSTARAAGVEVRIVRDPAKVNDAATADGRMLVVDLSQDGAIDAAVAWKQSHAGRPVIGFVSHVDTDTIARAKSAGIDRVMARGGFTAQLESILRGEN
jgi:hypothetical protein